MSASQINAANPLPQTPAPVVAAFRHVSRYFENPGFVRALANASFEIRRGEIFGVLGPKGSGKSAALRILAGKLSPSEGKAKVFGRSPRRRSARTRIAYLPEEGAEFQGHFLARMLSFPSKLLAKNRDENRTSLLHASRRRANLAQILASAPELIVLDEPFSGLDLSACAELKELLLALARRGRTIVLSGDSLDQTADICDRIAILYAGSVQAIGTLSELLTHPEAIRFTAPLLPAATAGRVLQVICKDLARGDAPGVAGSIGPVRQVQPLQSGADSIADELLSPLIKKENIPSPEPAAHSMVQIDHDKLARLTRQR